MIIVFLSQIIICFTFQIETVYQTDKTYTDSKLQFKMTMYALCLLSVCTHSSCCVVKIRSIIYANLVVLVILC